MRNLIFNRSLDSEDCKLTAGAAFVPQDSFQSCSKHKPHILQQTLWTEKELQLLAATARQRSTSCMERLKVIQDLTQQFHDRQMEK